MCGWGGGHVVPHGEHPACCVVLGRAVITTPTPNSARALRRRHTQQAGARNALHAASRRRRCTHGHVGVPQREAPTVVDGLHHRTRRVRVCVCTTRPNRQCTALHVKLKRRARARARVRARVSESEGEGEGGGRCGLPHQRRLCSTLGETVGRGLQGRWQAVAPTRTRVLAPKEAAALTYACGSNASGLKSDAGGTSARDLRTRCVCGAARACAVGHGSGAALYLATAKSGGRATQAPEAHKVKPGRRWLAS